ncbi:hypothetical protein KUCAC02_028660 [Chaenocephalus aceratus]|uniref:Uncharacterized protein n=1 Tax=Chaenocephalus aceratus TaxID=36190 RepID=A0ACB9X3D1_CHAAC|nr:hypothetical protein KUCAC02_028660 [Chaenocephalus aceratus]
MLGLCLYVPVSNSDTFEVEYFESNGLPSELKSLFNKLSVFLPSQEFSSYKRWRKKTFKREESNSGGQLDFEEFVHYLQDYEKDLKLLVKSLTSKNTGHVDHQEFMQSLQDLGVYISPQHAEKALKSMDKNGMILLAEKTENIPEIILYWKHSTIFDVGDNLMVPDEFTVEEKQTGIWWRHLVAGGGAGAVSRTFTAPLDRLKVMMQRQNTPATNGYAHLVITRSAAAYTLPLWIPNQQHVHHGPGCMQMIREGDQKLICNEKQTLGILDRFVAGSLAGVLAQSTIYPMEVLKTRLALRKTGQYSSISDCAKQIFRREGTLCFFIKAISPTCWASSPTQGIDLAVYETLKNRYLQQYGTNSSDPGVLVLLACGTVSSTCGQLASYPLALVRTRMQAQAAVEGSQQMTMSGLFRQILQTEGPKGLYRGLAPNFLKVIPAVSISYVVYEHLKTQLGVKSR